MFQLCKFSAPRSVRGKVSETCLQENPNWLVLSTIAMFVTRRLKLKRRYQTVFGVAAKGCDRNTVKILFGGLRPVTNEDHSGKV